MRNENLDALILNQDEHESAGNKLQKLLSTLRKHLCMQAAFISEFIDGKRVYRFVDAEDSKNFIRVGESDPLETTYCKRIVDKELDNIIRDTKKNDITNKLDVTDKLSMAAHMGVPIILSNGEVYGTFCCYKTTPDETLNNRDLSFLNGMAEIAGQLIDNIIKSENRYSDITERIESVLDKNEIDIHYQPIYSLQMKSVSGYESLSRFTPKPYRTPDIWFSEAAHVGLGESLEMIAIKKAVEEIDKFDGEIFLSINVSPEYVMNGSVSKALADINTNRIVLEITEHSPIKDYSHFRKVLEPLRARGIRLAIDDAGAGYSSFKHILELEADIIKLDISLTQNIHDEPRKFLLAKALCAFAKAIKCNVLAEGIENEEDLNTLRDIGVDEVQGFLLGHPMPVKEAVSASCGTFLH